MKFASTGTPAASQSSPSARSKRGGFTLLEALVALTVVLAFASALGPFLFQARQIMINAEGGSPRRSLACVACDAFDAINFAEASREGDADGFRWRISAEPIFIDALVSAQQLNRSRREQPDSSAPERPSLDGVSRDRHRMVGSGASISADTVRLAKAE